MNTLLLLFVMFLTVFECASQDYSFSSNLTEEDDNGKNITLRTTSPAEFTINNNNTLATLKKFSTLMTSMSNKTYECGGIVNRQEGFLSSPNYPNNSFYSVECEWLIQLDKKQTVNLTILSMDLGNDCEKSFIAVYNGNGPSCPRIGKYCGMDKPDPIISRSNSLWIEYRYEVGSTGTGFQMKYEPESLGCGGIYHDREGFIRTPNYIRYYPNNAEIMWEIRSNPGYCIRLHFIGRFLIQNSDKYVNNYVEIWNWQDEEWISIAKKWGRNIPNTLQSTGDRVKIVFISNNRTIEFIEFTAKWEWICGGTFIATDKPRTIVSPGYPISYEGNLNCTYHIVSKTRIVIINFDDFELEKGSKDCDHDNVTITKALFRSLHSSKPLCGTTKPPPLRAVEKATITFKTNAIGSYKGFRFTYTDDGCVFNITQATIIKGPHVESERFSSGYGVYSCVWRITAPPKQVVVIRIIFLDIPEICALNSVGIFKSLNETRENKLVSLCGNMTDLAPIFSDTGNMLVKLHTSTYAYNGFSAQIYFTHGPAEGCGGTINLSETKHIQAPDLEDLDCSWKIRAPRGYQIQVHITDLDLPGECTNNSISCSFVEIHDGLSIFAELIEKIDSKWNARPDYRKFSTSLHGGYIRLVLAGRRSNAFKATLIPVLSKCGPSILNATSEVKTLTSPNYPSKYPPNIKCSWEIFANDLDKIELHFTDFNITGSTDGLHICNGDTLVIREDLHRRHITTEDLGPETVFRGNDRYYMNKVATHTYCGNSVFDYFSKRSSLMVTFKSLSSPEQGRGFKIEYRENGCIRTYTAAQGRLFASLRIADCVVTITVPENRTISLYIDILYSNVQLNCNNEGIEVRDSGPNGTLLSHFCGWRVPDPIFSFTNKLYLLIYKRFYNGRSGAGYDMVYTSTDAGRGCGGELYNHKGRVSSPLYPNQFRNNTVCKWVIRVPVSPYAALKFYDFDIQGSCNQTYVKITTYLNNNKLDHTFCQHDNPPILRSNSQIDIEYSSSEQNGGSGWMALFRGVDSETTNV